jgi:hypothetical protein
LFFNLTTFTILTSPNTYFLTQKSMRKIKAYNYISKTAVRKLTPYFLIAFLLLIKQNIQAQTYVQVPVTGGVTSPNNYGPFSDLYVRGATLYRASELGNLPLNTHFSSIGFKLLGYQTINNIHGGAFKMYVIPTTDTIFNLTSNWNALLLHPGLIEVFNDYYTAAWTMPASGHIDFNLKTPFSLQPNQGFYLAYDWESYPWLSFTPPFECNTALNGYKVGKNNNHNNVYPATLTTSSNYRHVIRLGYAGGVTGIPGEANSEGVIIYPNPTREILHVRLSNYKTTVTQVTLRDLTGKVVKIVSLKNEESQINLTGISPGIYSLQLSNPSETVVKRIIIE